MALQGYLARVRECNTHPDELRDFVPLLVDGVAVGLLLPAFAARLAAFPDVFQQRAAPAAVVLSPSLATPQARTDAVASCMRQLKDDGAIKGWRDELFPVAADFDSAPLLLIERACVPHFGIKAYGVHVNCYVQESGNLEMFVARRSRAKSTWPLLLDHMVAGGLGHGLSPSENVVKECGEEASVPAALAARARPVGVVAYTARVPEGVKRDVLFCYDLELPPDFVPVAADGEVEEFMRWPLERVAQTVRDTQAFKPNCSLVIIDFLARHGYLTPDTPGYLTLLASLRNGDVS
jgi:8-oxo-dGTP pyrophosphatase MutT (NUDIX family)